MWSETIKILSIVGILSSLVSASYIYFANRKSLINIFIASTIFFSSAWAASLFITLETGNFFVAKLPFFFGAFIPASFVLFVYAFSGIAIKKKHYFLAFMPALIIAILSLSGRLLFDDVAITSGAITTNNPGILMPVYGLYHLIYISFSAYQVHKANKNLTGIKKVQLRYVTLAMIVSYGGAVMTDAVLIAMGIYQFDNLGPIFALLFSAVMIYVATKHHILEIKVVISEFLAFLLVVSVFILLWLSRSYYNLIVFIIVGMIAAIFVQVVLAESGKNWRLKTQNRQLLKAKKDLEKLDSMRDEFMKMATHELSTPTAALKTILSSAIEEKSPQFTLDQKKELEPALEAANRLQMLIKNILEASFIEEGGIWIDRKETDLEELIGNAVKSFSTTAKKKGIILSWKKSNDSIPLLMIDREKIYEVIRHLIENAIKFTYDGEVSVKNEIVRNSIVITVSDTGVGIPHQDQQNVFSKFFQSGRFDEDNPLEQQGAGLGLFISKHVVELHGGKMEFRSQEGKGSTFWITLPLNNSDSTDSGSTTTAANTNSKS